MTIDARNSIERAFVRKLEKAGWHTYRDEETGRVVTNAYTHECEKLKAISGLECEVVCPPFSEGTCAKIGPRM